MSTPPRDRRPILSFSVSNSATISNPSSRNPAVVGQREPEVAGPHDRHAHAAVEAENLPQVPPQLLDVVADAADAELAEIRQVLPDLRRVQVELLGERLRRNRPDARRVERVQAAQIDRQPIGRQLGNRLGQRAGRRLGRPACSPGSQAK